MIGIEYDPPPFGVRSEVNDLLIHEKRQRELIMNDRCRDSVRSHLMFRVRRLTLIKFSRHLIIHNQNPPVSNEILLIKHQRDLSESITKYAVLLVLVNIVFQVLLMKISEEQSSKVGKNHHSILHPSDD